MRIISCITQPSVIDQILTHRRRATTAAPGGARSPPIDPGARDSGRAVHAGTRHTAQAPIQFPIPWALATLMAICRCASKTRLISVS